MNGNNLNNAGTVNTYNLTSPNGTISTQAINTNGQPISASALYLSDTGSEISTYGYWSGNHVIGQHAYCALGGFAADYGTNASVQIAYTPPGENPVWELLSDGSLISAICFD